SDYEKQSRPAVTNPKKRKAAESVVHPTNGKKVNATIEQRIEILDWIHEKKATQKRACEFFSNKWPHLKLKQPLISAWLKEESLWRER
ncbi:hypothetical protein CPC08DRAFT_612085, partial [Agrocybe pediades]